MGDENFQQFLKLLNEIEKKDELNQSQNLEIDRSGDSFCTARSSGEEQALDKTVSKMKQRKPSSQFVLRQPGFVYRTKNSKDSTFLDNNLWEFRCRRRILRTPSFKFRQMRKSSLSPYSLRLLDDLSGLSLSNNDSSTHSKIEVTKNSLIPKSSKLPAITSEFSTAKCIMTTREQPIKFIPLSSKNSMASKAQNHGRTRSHRRHPVMRPAKLMMLQARLPKIEEGVDGDRDCVNNAWGNKTDNELPTYATLSQKGGMLLNFSQDSQLKSANWKIPETKSFASSSPSISTGTKTQKKCSNFENSCSYQARMSEQDMSVDELSLCMEDFLVLPQKMSSMAEMMYT